MHFEEGSPPHGRGKGGTDRSGDLRHGFTPAQAGKRKEYGIGGHSHEDHPRVGGEKVSPLSAVALSRGSPPHGRGKDGKFIRINESTGITPAWAGKRAARGGSSSSSWDHPRTGGENNTTTRHRTSLLGSPPRGRGKVADTLCTISLMEITPADTEENASQLNPRP